jgi:cation:H+ antiporter
MLLNLLLFCISLAGLLWSSDKLIDGASHISFIFGVPTFLIGLTVVGIGSSAPEMVIAAVASLNQQNDAAIGNVIGSNTANILLILGLTACIKPLKANIEKFNKELSLMVLSCFFSAYLISDRQLTQLDAILLFCAFFIIMWQLIYYAVKNHQPSIDSQHETQSHYQLSLKKSIIYISIGLILLPISAKVMIDNASEIARFFGVSELVIGVSVLAIGTSLPELATAISGALKNEDEIVFGNIIGSNLFNILLVLSIPGFINPSHPGELIDSLATTRDLYIMLASSLLLPLLLFIGNKPYQLSRWKGIVMSSLYIAYQVVIILPFIKV